MDNVLFHQLHVNQNQMAETLEQMAETQNRMIDQQNRMAETFQNRMIDQQNRMAETLDRVELQVSALVENAYRWPRGCRGSKHG